VIACDPYGACAQLPSGTSPYSTSIVITVDNQHSPLPFGTIDTPGPAGTASGTGYVNFGWVLTPQSNIVPIDASTMILYIDGQAVGHPVYNQYRSDIASLFPGLRNTNGAVGYFYVNTAQYAAGLHSIAWGVYDSAGNAAGIGSRNFTVPVQAAPLQMFIDCASASGSGSVCQLAAGDHILTAPIVVGRTGVSLMGASSDATQTRLIRGQELMLPMMEVGDDHGNATTLPLTNIMIQNLTFCGGTPSARAIRAIPAHRGPLQTVNSKEPVRPI
jgi:hypothetical protein